MAFDYTQIESKKAAADTNFFLDANIWMLILAPPIKPSFKQRAYRKFFESILEEPKAKIVLPSLVLSEVINRLLREVHMGKYILKQKKADQKFSQGSDYYKSVFRKTEEFRIAYALICDEIKNYHPSITLIGDNLGSELKFKHILSNLPPGLDFNDFFYFQLCKLNGYVLVTDDKDFWIDGIRIYTQNEALYNKFIQYKVNAPKLVQN